jgi:hypothetical protein
MVSLAFPAVAAPLGGVLAAGGGSPWVHADARTSTRSVCLIVVLIMAR